MYYTVIASRNGQVKDSIETTNRKYAYSYYRYLKKNYSYVEIIKVLKNGKIK